MKPHASDLLIALLVLSASVLVAIGKLEASHFEALTAGVLGYVARGVIKGAS